MILFPMAGLSSRFFKAGYDKPKYMLKYGGKSVFRHVVEGFGRYIGVEPFLFICRADDDTPIFVRGQLEALGFSKEDFGIVVLDTPTRGQAETVALGLKGASIDRDGALTIFNVDTVRHDFRRTEFAEGSSGYLEVFHGEGTHWSFVLPEDDNDSPMGRAKLVREKERISPLCSNGLYHFESVEIFGELYAEQLRLETTCWKGGELFVAPLYQLGIDRGMVFHYVLCDLSLLDFCGVPAEYELLLAREGV
ncbi:glycosyltransferase family protein [Thiorhodovibrio frisius]|uniref:Uncharacterized protein n=1 Tax=Thiorhodovibrio frisius TaxID=631362 RepID=H8Z1Y0_9GAMM|nr:NTP transferase domain-containing protein [Thiorhodovibrio frisius]EIC22608.1 hypothetical protein Thi970DRAFT_02882 [Thiorhodovibrio frisius]WPL20049.1 hypothetical protein Thiofri_00102 [Thiorhodovibrio frisius]